MIGAGKESADPAPAGAPPETLNARNCVEAVQGPVVPAPPRAIDPEAVTVIVVVAPMASGVTLAVEELPLGSVSLSAPPIPLLNVKLSPESRVTIGADSTREPLGHVTLTVEGEAAAFAGEAESIPAASSTPPAQMTDIDFDKGT